MVDPATESSLYVVFTAAGQRYAVRHEAVLEMVQPPKVVPLPGAGRGVLGLINLRGKVLGLVDFRIALGQPSAASELKQLLDDFDIYRKHHTDWVDELEASIREGRAFRLTTDPHACAFGRWFDNFSSDNVVLHEYLQAFDEPHQQIHALAKRVLARAESGDVEGALAEIAAARNGVLATMLNLFTDVKAAVTATHREIAIVMPGEGAPVAVLVDSVDSIEPLAQRDDAELGESAYHPLLAGIATDDEDELVLLVDDRAIVRVFSQAA